MTRIQFRRLDGILLLDKSTGMSSNAALQVARRLFRAEKGGHTGSLDPLATGLLPLCFGEATKIAGLLLGSAKAYDAEIMLGQTTDTDDAEGQVLLQRPVPSISAETLQAALAGFMQGVGYSFSCLGPFLVGWLHTVSDGWTIPFSFLFGCATLMLCASWVACKPRKLEDLW